MTSKISDRCKGLSVFATTFCLFIAGPAESAVTFVNDTGAPVTDFHFKLVSTLGPYVPDSNPWGAGTSTSLGGGEFMINYAGAPIAAGGKLVIDGDLTDSSSRLFTDFTWTPGGQPATPSVPEPAAWAMMFLGSGMVGYALRSRRKSKVTTRVAFA